MPIAGLVHHGSGPRHTSLVDPAFATGLAVYALAVAARYPWLTHYTPLNEPLTTARFSGLYCLWYPHGRNDRTFVQALLVQCRAAVLAMRAVRDVNPAANLVQTDDLRLLSRGDMDIADPASVEQALERLRPWAIVNASGYVRVDDAEHDIERGLRENAHGPAALLPTPDSALGRFLQSRQQRTPRMDSRLRGNVQL
jgi:hypothetical protein